MGILKIVIFSNGNYVGICKDGVVLLSDGFKDGSLYSACLVAGAR